MFPHLRIWLIVIGASSVAGAVVIEGLAFGRYELSTFLWAGGAGLAIGIPAALLNWDYLRPKRSREVGLMGQAPPDTR